MRTMVRIAVSLLMVLGLTGCFQIDQVITLSPDGSGTIEETFLISRRISESMGALTSGIEEAPEPEGAAAAPKKGGGFFKDEEIRMRAESYGDGVKLVSTQRISDNRFEGYRAVYAFRDINKIRIDQSTPGQQRQGEKEGGSAAGGAQFVFKPGKTATLVIRQPRKGETVNPEGSVQDSVPVPGGQDTGAEELAMVRQMFEGLKISTTLVVQGSIVETNATHRNGARITIAEVDFGRILDKPELLAKMAAMPQGDQAAALEMIKTMPGMKMDLNDELRVSFR